MTDKQLLKLGLVAYKTITNPDDYWYNVTDTLLTIPRNAKIKNILEIMYQKAYEQGISQGKMLRSWELKNLINNNVMKTLT
jgi:hypothetical protein